MESQALTLGMESLPYGLIIAAVSGMLGAAFFMLVEFQTKVSTSGDLADIREMWTLLFVIARCIVGIGAASILYFFFKSGLLEGNLWPNLQQLGFVLVESGYQTTTGARVELIDTGRKVVPNGDFALLVVWSFLAGWSQKLVPNLLLATEGRTS